MLHNGVETRFSFRVHHVTVVGKGTVHSSNRATRKETIGRRQAHAPMTGLKIGLVLGLGWIRARARFRVRIKVRIRISVRVRVKVRG